MRIRPAWWPQFRFMGRKRIRGGILRHIRTTNEIRQWDDEHGRPARSPRRLPTVYDDIWRRFDRCWKSYRKDQYHPVEMSEIDA